MLLSFGLHFLVMLTYFLSFFFSSSFSSVSTFLNFIFLLLFFPQSSLPTLYSFSSSSLIRLILLRLLFFRLPFSFFYSFSYYSFPRLHTPLFPILPNFPHLLLLCLTFFLIFFYSSFPASLSTLPPPSPTSRSISLPLSSFPCAFSSVPWPAQWLTRTRCEGGQTIKQRSYVIALCHHLRVTKTGTYWVFRKSLPSQREVSLTA